ncbi:N-acetylmuramoyl-L-alanine amidase [Dongia mobilis]|uniref:N-acetylmuramoyl-L-alanine amidase n=1 Tax=Dongia mobilis TaxID=578943 RepID=A0A4V3DEY5_9PROT|nr:N-acetylmuramoyl-L-alanine amidase [Dongia mobilis]TDQ83951.1 N-acetylmuramoyl-L-alanine amidase [Dongia mobilis]
MDLIDAPSPNHDSRDGQQVDILLLHYTGMKTGEEAIQRLRDPAAKVSAHYVVEEDGRIFHLVAEERRAWHAGVSAWRGHTNTNARSIGIEVVNPGHEWGYRLFPPAQMQAVLALSRAILSRHRIPPRNVIGHSDVAPARKEDPGELFDWRGMAAAGVGLWPVPRAATWERSEFFARLAEYGYGVEDEAAAARAFCRHFRPGELATVPDAEMAALLNGLLAMVS